MLQHLATTYAGEGWSQFLDTGGLAPRWSQTVIAGQSLGAAQAVLIGMQYSVDRVAAFAGWADAKHGWVKLGKTPSSRHFTLNHQREALFERTCFAYVALGLAPGCPLRAPTCRWSTTGSRRSARRNSCTISSRSRSTESTTRTTRARHGTVGSPVKRTARRQRSCSTPGARSSATATATAVDVDQRADNCPDTANAGQTDTDARHRRRVRPHAAGHDPAGHRRPRAHHRRPTGPAGATVPYTVTATDDIDGPPSVLCTPSTGSLFAIGNTGRGRDRRAGNPAHASSSSPCSAPSNRLQPDRQDRQRHEPARRGQGATDRLVQSLVAGFDPNNAKQRKAACLTLRAFITVVRFVAPPAQAAEWTADANRIRAVLAC